MGTSCGHSWNWDPLRAEGLLSTLVALHLLGSLEVQAVLLGSATWALLLEIRQCSEHSKLRGDGAGDARKKMGVNFPSLSWR